MADRKISDLTALTTPASGDYLPIVDISETAASSKNKRITIEELFRGVPLGTAAAPSIAIEGDENTGIYSPGADQLALATGGSGRLFINASGKVGVGGLPSGAFNKFSVNGSLGNFEISDEGNTINFTAGVTSYIRTTTLGMPLQFAAGFYVFTSQNLATEFMLIDSSGRLGLGTSSPGCELEIGGNGHIHLADQGRVGCNSGSGEPNDAYVKFYDSDIIGFHTTDTERARIDSSGRLLVGTSTDSGGALLQVNGDRVRIATAKTPASATATGTTGEVCWDADYIYVCTATNTWKRTAISTWP